MKSGPVPAIGPHELQRRQLCVLTAGALAALGHPTGVPADAVHPNRKWYLVAEAMRQRAIGWGDQPYGAVLLTPDGIVAQGPSRVVKDADPDAHAERVAIREAQRRLGRASLAGSVLYSTARPCALCARAAADAHVARMYFGPAMTDAGRPFP